MAFVLETVGLEKRFGGLVATNDVSLKVEKGARHALIGPNGAGKTTIINLLTGVLTPTAGAILLDDDDITPLMVFLMADESSYISGSEFNVDGGEYGHAGVKRYSDLARQGGLDKKW